MTDTEVENRNPGVQWFITFPQWVHTDIKAWKGLCPKTIWGFVAEESHENGGVHYHLGFKCAKKTTFVEMLKHWTLKFPQDYKRIKIERMKNITNAWTYCQKEKLAYNEWGIIFKIPKWIQQLKDEWAENADAVERSEARLKANHLRRIREIHESELDNLYCFKCGSPDCDCMEVTILGEIGQV